MMTDWKEYKLEEIAEIHNTRRIPLSSMERAIRKGEFPYYGASGIIDFVDDYLFDGEYLLISEDGENLNSRNTPIAFKANGKFWVNNHAHIVKGKEKHMNILLTYFFSGIDLTPYITGAVQPKLSKENLMSIPILLPVEIEEQIAITEVLSSLDDKIDLLHRQNKTLEALAETLFRQWFVEEADKEWEESTIGNNILTVLGGTPSTTQPEYWDGDVPWINSGEVNKFRIIEPTRYITKKGLSNSNTRLLPKGTTVIAITGGTLGQISLLEIDTCANQSVIGIIPNDRFPRAFVYFWIKKILKDILLNETDGAQPHINKNDVNEAKLIIPTFEFLNKSIPILETYFNKITQNVFQIRSLTHLRDTLLPKLMSGEVRMEGFN